MNEPALEKPAKRGLLRTPGRRSKFLYYELRTKANLVSGRWWWSNSSGPHGKKQQQTHFVVSVYTIMGEQKTQDHLKTQDASTVDASKLTALTPEVVRANSWSPSLNPTITKSLHFLPLYPVLCLFFFLYSPYRFLVKPRLILELLVTSHMENLQLSRPSVECKQSVSRTN